MNLEQAIMAIEPINQEITEKALEAFHSLAMPLDSLGLLQSAVVDICGAMHTTQPNIDRRAVVVFCADNGVVAEGVTQTGQHVTAAVARSLATHSTGMCKMARYAKIDIFPVDIGIKEDVTSEGILQRKIMNGTGNIAKGPAMTRKQAVDAIEVGINIAIALQHSGYSMLAMGEMGIGNTTTSSALASVLLDKPVIEVTGAGAGLSNDGILRKRAVIERAIFANKPNKNDAIDMLSKIGGLDICGMAGLAIGCAAAKIPCLIDGLIASVAARCAQILCPDVTGYLLASHVTAEPAGKALLDLLGKEAIIAGKMRLGEGSGAVAVVPLIDMAMRVYADSITFDGMEIEAYQPLT